MMYVRRPIPVPFCAFLAGCALSGASLADDFVPNDVKYAERQWYGPLMHMPTAWGISQGSRDVTVAVLDTGVIPGVPDLVDRVLPTIRTNGNQVFDPLTQRHGTWVSSVYAMQINNTIGGAGAGNFSILPVVVTNSNANNSTTWIIDGILAAANAGAKVINISLSTLDYAGVNNAAAYAESKGALVFMAIGNSDRRNLLSGLDNIIFVSGTNRQDTRWTNGNGVGSDWAAAVDLCAPADDVLIADPTLQPNGMGIIDGTSFAAPLAGGAAALAWSINPQLTPAQVRNILYTTAVDLGTPGWDEMYGNGRVDYGSVAQAALATLPEPSSGCVLLAAGMTICRRSRRKA